MNLEELFRVQKPMRDSPSWTETFLRVRVLHGARQVDALRDAESDLVHVVNHLIPLEGQTRWPVMTAESEKRLLKTSFLATR